MSKAESIGTKKVNFPAQEIILTFPFWKSFFFGWGICNFFEVKALATIAGEFWELLDSDGSKAWGILVDGMAAQPEKRQSVDGEQHAHEIYHLGAPKTLTLLELGL